MNDFMTVKEISDLCEKNEKTVRRWIDSVLPNKTRNGVETRLSLDEVEMVFNKAFGAKVSQMLMSLAQTGQSVQGQTGQSVQGTKTNKVEYHLMEAMKELMNRQASLEQSYTKRVLLPRIEAPKPQYFSIKAWVALHEDDFGSMTKGDYISLGRKATRLSKNQYYDVQYVPDENWGTIGTYHIDILKQL